MATPPLSPDEAALWARVMAQVRPMAGRKSAPVEATTAPPKTLVSSDIKTLRGAGHGPVKSDKAPPKPFVSSDVETPRGSKVELAKARVLPVAASRLRSKRTQGKVQPPPPPANTLDGTWDKQLARGLVSPDRTIDLHGHTLGSAYDLLDAALAAAIRAGDRVVLLVTGKPPRPASERPHARGAIRAATGDWLAGSRHAAAIAAVRGAHPRHGGAGALYIVLKRPRTPTGSSAEISRKY